MSTFVTVPSASTNPLVIGHLTDTQTGNVTPIILRQNQLPTTPPAVMPGTKKVTSLQTTGSLPPQKAPLVSPPLKTPTSGPDTTGCATCANSAPSASGAGSPIPVPLLAAGIVIAVVVVLYLWAK